MIIILLRSFTYPSVLFPNKPKAHNLQLFSVRIIDPVELAEEGFALNDT